jgi:hypothetical protein
MSQASMEYVSEWDGGYQVTTSCLVDLESGRVDAEAAEDWEFENVVVCNREFVRAPSGEEFTVKNIDGQFLVSELEALNAVMSYSASLNGPGM